MKKIVLTSLFALGLSGAALAQAATDFASVDTDVSGGNGELSAEEYDAFVAASAAPAAQ
jgi:hypothetical protein